MKPDISEFSYGYALTEELIHRSGLAVTAAPLFPSLLAEGRSGGGYDVHLPFSGFPLFLQFKLSHCMVKRSAYECRIGLFQPDFYRMHLRPLKHSRQHDLLLDLERKGYPVYYAAPNFHLPEELNDAYMNDQLIDRSAFFKPSEIGPLPDQGGHHVSFKTGYPPYLFSEPKQLLEESNYREHLQNDLINGFQRYPIIDGGPDSLHKFAEDLLSCIKKRRYEMGWMRPEIIRELKQREPRYQIGYIARTFFGCDVLLIKPNHDEEA